MFHTIQTLTRRSAVVLASGCAALALAAPASAQDLRSPDTRDAANGIQAVDPPSPDVLRAARATERYLSSYGADGVAAEVAAPASAQDLRSPDARDASRGIQDVYRPSPVALRAARATERYLSSYGVDGVAAEVPAPAADKQDATDAKQDPAAAKQDAAEWIIVAISVGILVLLAAAAVSTRRRRATLAR